MSQYSPLNILLQQKKLQRLYTREVRTSGTQLNRSQKRLHRLAFLRSPQLQAFLALSGDFHTMYNCVSALPPLDPSLTAAEHTPPEPGKRPWETSKAGYLNWAVEQLMSRAKGKGRAEGDAKSGLAAATHAIGSAQDVKAMLEAIAGRAAVAELGKGRADRMDTQ